MYKPKKGGSYSDPFSNINNQRTTGTYILPGIQDYLKMISTNTSTIHGYTNIINILSQESSLVFFNEYNANITLNTQTQIYNGALKTYGEQSSFFLSSISNIISTYAAYSTIESMSTTHFIEKYSRYAPTRDILGAMTYFSTNILSTVIEGVKSEIRYASTMVVEYTQKCLDDSKQISTIMSTEYYPQISTINELTAQLSVAKYVDSINAMNIRNATSTYTYYYDLQQKRAKDNVNYGIAYASAVTALEQQSIKCSTIRELYNFQTKQSTLMEAQYLLNSTSIMRQQLQNMITLQGQGVDVTSYFNNLVSAGIQVGGDQISNLLNTVNVLYSQYSTTVINLTNQINTTYQTRTPEQVASYIAETKFQSLMESYNNAINTYQVLYEGILPSTQIIADILSSQCEYYSTIYASTLSNEQINKIYISDIQNYSTTVREKFATAKRKQPDFYTYEASSFALKVREKVELDRIGESVREIVRLGGSISTTRELRVRDAIRLPDSVLDLLEISIISAQVGGVIDEEKRKEIEKNPEKYSIHSDAHEVPGGLLADLQARSTSQNQLVSLLSTTVQQISTGTLTLGDKTSGQLTTDLNSYASLYYEKSQIANTNLSTQMSCEMLSYLNSLESLSTSLLMNLLENTLTIESLSYTNEGIEIAGTSTTTHSTSIIQTLKDNSQLIHPMIDTNSTFINMIIAENFVRKYYVQQKAEYEKQSYYRTVSATPEIAPDLMNPGDFDNLILQYDLAVQNVNRYVGNREAYYTNFVNSLAMTIAFYMSPSISTDIQSTHNVLYVDPVTSVTTTYVLSSVYPLTMEFNRVPFRTVIFAGRALPPASLVTCPITSMSSQSIVQHVSSFNPNDISYAPDTTVYGFKGQYVSIQRPDNNVEILQILVIDSTGKNVAFGATVTAPTIPNRTGDLPKIVDGNYDTTSVQALSFISRPTDNTTSVGITKTIWINLGAVYDITAVQYLKSDKSPYNSIGFSVQIFAADQVTAISPVMTTSTNTPTEWLDFRVTDTKATGEPVPMFMSNVRYGKCGILARYIRIRPSTVGKLQISQIAVVSSDGDNHALGLTATFVNGSSITPIPAITDGTYCSRNSAQCYINSAVIAGAYIQLDFSKEIDVTAVHIYNTNTHPSFQAGTIVDLYTGDNQLAVEKVFTTNNMKEVLDFRYFSSDTDCPTEMNWPIYYGVAGIITQFIGIEATNGPFGFSKIEVIDKSGRDVALYNQTYATSSLVPNTSYLGVTNYVGPQPAASSYQSGTGQGVQMFVVDLQQEYEICAINIYACSDNPSLLNGTNLEFYDSNPFINTSYKSFYTKPIILSGLSSFFDTRRNSESSTWPTTVTDITTSYGPFGTLANYITIPGNPASVKVTDGTGRGLTGTMSYDGTTTTVVLGSSSVLYEINSVVITGSNPPIGTFVSLHGCNNIIVGYQPLLNYTDPMANNASFILADFRNPSKNPYAPMEPLPAMRYDTMPSTTAQYHEISTMYGTINPDTGMNNSPPKGLLTRYVKIVPRDVKTPLYISQIVVVDSNGINVAFDNDTFTPNSTLIKSGAFVVDGIFAMSLDDPNYSLLSLADYVSKPVANSFVSVAGDPESNYITIDLGMEYLVNSVIYVSAKGQFDAGQGVIVELYNAQVERVAVKPVSKYVALFGVDVLDFRKDITELVTDPGCWLEVRPRVVQLGPAGCGIMGQYIRIISAVPGTEFVLSQLVVTDSNGNNIALYKPTYSSTNSADAHKIVDGTYYQRLTRYAYASNPSPEVAVDYIEVNLGNDLEIVNVFVVNAQDSPQYSFMKIQVYNSHRDNIANLNMTNYVESPDYSNMVMNSNNFNFPSNRNNANTLPVYRTTLPVLGVNILTKLSPFSEVGGLTPASMMPPRDAPEISTIATFPIMSSCTPTPASLSNLFTRGSAGGIPGRFVRIYNVDRYIQVSQIMVYGPDGTNYAYHAPARAESVFPGTYVATVTDGEGGYFHAARVCGDCYKSNGSRYDFLEVDCGSTNEIVGVRCVFASDNQGQNVGAQIQILTDDSGSAGAVIAQHVTTSSEFAEVLVDFRRAPVNTSIQQLIMPKMFTTQRLPSSLIDGGPNGMVEGVDGTLYIVDTIQHCVWSTASSAPYFGIKGTAKTDLTGLRYPVGIATDGTYFYVSDYGNSRILKIPAPTGTSTTIRATTFVSSVTNPYGLFYTSGNLYCTCNNSAGTIYSYNTTGTTSQTKITPSTTIPFPNSIIVIGSYYYISSATTGRVYKVSVSSPYTTVPVIGSTPATTTRTFITVPLVSISAIIYDNSENVLFISDYVQDKIFAVTGLTGTSPLAYNLGGTGNGGYTGDGSQGIFATMDGPMCLQYSPSKGFLYISDYKNSTIRYLQIYSSPPLPFSTTTAVPRWPGWATTTLENITDGMTTAQASTALVQNPVEFTSVTVPTLITNILTTNITAFYITGTTLYYVNGSNALYSAKTTGTFSPTRITPSPATTFGTITSLTTDSKYLYLCDSTNNCVYRMLLVTPYTITKYISSSGATVTATLKNPTWIGFDKYGTFYISDTGNFCIRRLSGLSQLEVYVGGEGQGTTAPIKKDVYGIQALLNTPGAFVFDSNNNLIFVDSGQNAIYKVGGENRMGPISPNVGFAGQVGGATSSSSSSTSSSTSTKLGSSTSSSTSTAITTTTVPIPFIDTFYAQSAFPTNIANTQIRTPYGIAINSSDTLYITAKDGQQIIQLTLNTVTGIYIPTIVSGFGSDTVGRTSATDTNAYTACLSNPTAIQCLAGSETLYFIDNSNKYLRMITPQVTVSYPQNLVIPYGPLISLANDTKNTYNTTVPSGGDEKFGILENFQANFVCTSVAGNLYFPNKLLNTVVKLDSSGNITVIATGFSQPEGIVMYNDSTLYVADYKADTISSIIISSGAKSTLISGVKRPYALAITPLGYLFYSYNIGSGTSTTGTPTIGIYNLRKGSSAGVSIPITVTSIQSVAVDTDGNLYVAVTIATGSGRYIDYAYSIYMYPITYTNTGPTVGTKVTIPTSGGPFNGLAFSNGKLMYSSSKDKSVYSIQTLPTVETTAITVVGQNSVAGPPVDGSYSQMTSLNGPLGLCVDSNNVLYLLDTKLSGNMVLLKNTNYTVLQKNLTYTIAGSNTQGSTVPNQLAYFQNFTSIGGVCYDSQGQIYICDTGTHSISMINIEGILTTFAGVPGTSGYGGDGGSPTSATLNGPTDIKMSRSNVLYVADTGNNCIRRIKRYGSGYQINTFGTTFTNGGPLSIAIDNNENVYITNGSYYIYVITPTEQVLPYFQVTRSDIVGYDIFIPGPLAVNSSNILYYIDTTYNNVHYLYFTLGTSFIYSTSDTVYSQPFIVDLLTKATGMCFDASDNLYISDGGANYVYKIPSDSITGTFSGTLTPVVGNGLGEPIFTGSQITQIAQNIYGAGLPPTDRPLYSPGPLSFNPVKGVLIGQPTKITVYNLTAPIVSTNCGTNTTGIAIKNNSTSAIYLSQLVVLNNHEMNIVLNTAGFKYQDGFYGSKTSASSFEIAASATLNVSVSDDVVCILLYIGTTGKTKWNGATVTLNGEATTTRTITGLVDKPSVQKIILDYRKKTPVCMPFNNYMKSYRLQDNSTTVSTSYRPLYTRYVYVTTDASNVMLALSQVVILHAETGENLALNSVLITSYYGVLTTNSYANNKYYVSEFPVSQYDYWIKFDLGDEYPVEQVILYTNATNTPVSYKVKAYTSSHTQIQNPTYSTLDLQVAYVRIQCSGTSAIVLQGRPSGISISSIKALTNKPLPTFTSYRSAGSTVAEYIEFTLTTPSMITGITVNSTISTGKPHQLIFYNQSRNEVFRTGLTYSPMTLSPKIPSILSYSFLPVVGTRQVRYVRYISNGDYPIQMSQILVIDKNGINVALNSTVTASSVGSSTLASVANSGSTGPAAIPFTTVSSDSSEYVQVDLGQEYEILEVVYVNSGANQTSSTGCKILLQDSFQCQLGSFTIEGIATGVEIYDCRRSGKYAALSYSVTASNDTVFTEAVYGRYVRFENSVANSAGATLSNLVIYDAYGKNISGGKKTLQPVAPVSFGGSTTQGIPNTTATSSNALNSTGYTTSGTPGDWWEIDLGDSYLIKDISATLSTLANSTTTALSTRIPYAIYGSYREELVRGFVSTSLTSPFTVPTNPTINTNTKSVRYVRISTGSGTSTVAGTYSLTHIAVIDSRGMDIGVWKPVRQVDTRNAVTFSMLDGRYSSTISITNIWDLDLGSSYNVCSLICYGSGTGFYVTAYDSTGAIVSGPVALTATASSPQTITLSTGGFTAVQNTVKYGKKTRYITLTGTGTVLNYKAIVAIDSLGRNVAYNANLYDSSHLQNTSPPYDFSTPTNAANFIQIDLGQEYYISFIVVYYLPSTPSFQVTTALLPSFDTTLNGATLTLMDATWKTTASKILAGTGATYSCSYSIGNVFTTNTNVTDVTKTCSSIAPTTTGTVVDMAIDISDNIYVLTTLSNKNTVFTLTKSGSNYNVATNYVFPDSCYIYGSTLYGGTIYYTGKSVDDASEYMKLYVQPAPYITTPTSIYILPPTGNSYCTKIVFGSTLAYLLFDTGSVYTTPIDTITNPRYAAASNLIITYTKITGLSEGIKYMCIDASDNLYMGSTGSSVYKYSGGTVTTFTGFNRPTGLVLDNNNYLYVADTSNNVLKVISPVGTISTVLGSGTAGFTDSSGSDVVTFTAPTCVVIDSASNIYVGEGRAGIRKITVQYTPNLSKFNLPFIGPYTTTSQVTFGSNITSKVGLQVVNNSFVGASYAEVLDLTS